MRVPLLRQRHGLILALLAVVGCNGEPENPVQEAQQARDEAEAAIVRADRSLDDVEELLGDVRQELLDERAAKVQLEQRLAKFQEELRETRNQLQEERKARQEAESELVGARERLNAASAEEPNSSR